MRVSVATVEGSGSVAALGLPRRSSVLASFRLLRIAWLLASAITLVATLSPLAVPDQSPFAADIGNEERLA